MKIMQIGTAKKVEQRKMLILDVRTGIDFGKAHIKDAVNIDQNAADFKELVEKQLDKQIPVFVYAENDEKSLAAGELLKSMNFRAVFVLEGGFPSWQKENYEVVFAM
jgi:rhodanese-related sulfurtransferase